MSFSKFEISEQKRVYSDLDVGDKVQWESYFPGRGRREKEGVIVETDLEHPIWNWAFRQYRVETETGWSRVSANDITGVLEQ